MHILFDFDGTIIDSFKPVIEKLNLLARQFDFRTISEQEIEALRELSSKELLNSFKIPFYKIPFFIKQVRKLLHAEIETIAPIHNIFSILKKLKQANFSLGIITSNSIENVQKWLKVHNMDSLFDFIHNESNFFSKGTLLKKTIKKYHIDKSKTYYIGDETRDIEAAKENNIQSIAVTWGYASEKILSQYQPSYLAYQPEDLLSIFGLEKNCSSQSIL